MGWKKILKYGIRVIISLAGLSTLFKAIIDFQVYQDPSFLLGNLTGIGLIVFLAFYLTRNLGKNEK